MSCLIPDEARVEAFLDFLGDRSIGGEGALESVHGQPLFPGLSPWALALLVALERLDREQRWAHRLHEDRIAEGLVGEEFGEGVVPEEPKWKFERMFTNLYFVHRVDGTRIGWTEGQPGRISWVDLITYLESLRTPPYPISTLCGPSALLLGTPVDAGLLDRAGLIEAGPETATLTERGWEAADRLAPLLEKIDGAPEAARFLALGDFAGALQHVSSSLHGASRMRLEELARHQKEARAGSLRRRIRTANDPQEKQRALAALAALGPEKAENTVLEQLEEDLPETIRNQALEILWFWNDRPHIERVLDLLGSCGGSAETILAGARVVLQWLDPGSISPEIASRLTEVLNRKPDPMPLDLPEEALETLGPETVELMKKSTPASFRARANLMLTCLSPGPGFEAIARDLRGSDPALVLDAIAALLALDTPRARQVLREIQDSEHPNRDGVRLALHMQNDPTADLPSEFAPEGTTSVPEEIAPGIQHGRFEMPEELSLGIHGYFCSVEIREEIGDLIDRWCGTPP